MDNPGHDLTNRTIFQLTDSNEERTTGHGACPQDGFPNDHCYHGSYGELEWQETELQFRVGQPPRLKGFITAQNQGRRGRTLWKESSYLGHRDSSTKNYSMLSRDIKLISDYRVRYDLIRMVYQLSVYTQLYDLELDLQ